MKYLSNSGTDRVLDWIEGLDASELDAAVPDFSLFGFEELANSLASAEGGRFVLPISDWTETLLGSTDDRLRRNRLTNRWLAGQMSDWLRSKPDLRFAPSGIPQAVAVAREVDGSPVAGIAGSFSFSTAGLGVAPSGPFNLINATESLAEAAPLARFFEQQWSSLSGESDEPEAIFDALAALSEYHSPSAIYGAVLGAVFSGSGQVLDEEAVVNSATGIRETRVWQKLYKFQRDGAVGAIDKLSRFGGCIIADSVGLGKTFEALAVIKYHELRNDRVLVLCPKRLRDNWTLYAANDQRNVLADDRFNYDVLNHTDLSRDRGMSGDIDLAHVNWGNYDLVVIDESHNFRNKSSRIGKETRYDRLMRQIVKEGVKTRVLMLSATPVNNRLTDLRNQIAFATEGRDDSLAGVGVRSIEATTRFAQQQFNRWLELKERQRTPGHLIEMLGFDYFSLLEALTIARSRKHVEKYYGTSETGTFPERRKPINRKPDIDLLGQMPPIGDINDEIRRLKLAAYAPLRYVLPHKQSEYERKYSTKLGRGKGSFKQADRENSLIHLMRVNMLKRLESSVHSFALTLERQLELIEDVLARLDNHDGTFDELGIADIDIEDPAFDLLLVGRRVKVLLSDVDRIRWRQDLEEDRDRLTMLIAQAKAISPARDAKLEDLRSIILDKVNSPINSGNRKVIVFTAFADTAQYLYDNLSEWAQLDLGINSALVMGSGSNKTNTPKLRKDFASILSAFAPIAKERPNSLADTGDIDLLIATDCISEGQNLQDCDWLVNYDIHWNPVRIVQRFGRIDRLGSPNESIQLVNFWPNIELEEYINLEQRVSGRMVLLDISATGEENLIERQSGDQMNDLEYRRAQLQKLQEAVIDLEDVATSISITDLTLTDFRIDLAEIQKDPKIDLERVPHGAVGVAHLLDGEIEPGILFCLRADDVLAERLAGENYPLAPFFLVHASEDGTIVLPHTRAKATLDLLRLLADTGSGIDSSLTSRFDAETAEGRDMKRPQALLSEAIRSIIGRGEERAVESLFAKGGTVTLEGEFAGSKDFEVVAWIALLDEET